MKLKLITLGIAVLMLSGCTANKTNISEATVPPTTKETASMTPIAVMDKKETKIISLAGISKHNKDTDCWFAVDGKVYDVTAYIASGKHPGDEKILLGCGKDATELYATKAGKGEDHSEKARGYLANFEIGTLAK